MYRSIDSMSAGVPVFIMEVRLYACEHPSPRAIKRDQRHEAVA
jgi:hypothetical protein